MNSKHNLFFALLLCVFFLASCMTVGESFSSVVTWIQVNKTTKKEIEKAYGPPFRTGYDSGLFTLSYGYYKYSLFTDSKTKDLIVRFNKDGTVHNYTFNSSFPEDKKVMESDGGGGT